MKWKTTILIFIFAIGSFISVIKYYGFTWQELSNISFYQNLANPSVRVVKIQEGLRKEQVADIVGKKMGWDEEEKIEFENAHLAFGKESLEGYYFPKSYLLDKDNTPTQISKTMLDEFRKETKNITKAKTTKVVNEETALKIASIIQRESGGKKDMRLISGIIWNRIFAGMKLQMDATLQYAKGNEEDGWWPKVIPEDKNIESPYNTYMYNSLPPTPIANPGIAAIEAAYNPQKTSCMFYLHDKKGNIHCSKTYSEHKKNIEKYY